MKTLAHLVKRDFKDQMMIWAVAGLLTALLIVPTYILKRAAFEQMVSALAASYFLFFTLYCQSVWGEQGMGAGVPRFYLQTLPVSRRRVFLMSLVRGSIGGLPLIVLGFLGWPTHWLLGEDISPLARIATGLTMMAVIVAIQSTVSSTASFPETYRRASSPRARFWVMLRHFGSLFADVGPLAILALLPSIAVARNATGMCCGAFVLLVAFFEWRMVVAYRKWLWE